MQVIVSDAAVRYLNVARRKGCHAKDERRYAMKEEFSPEGMTALFKQASRLIHGMGFSGGMTPAQWVALRYFADAPPFSRTMANLARFQGITLAPVTRTVRMLIDKGYVERHPNPRSRRADLIIVNKAGRKALEIDPTHKLVEIIASIPNEDRECLVRSMKTILDGMLEFGLAQFDESLLLKLEDR
ncbi:MAG: MarR family transcriptional regulator [Rhodospirillaceae bacterium]